MQWLLQDFDDTRNLAVALDRLGLPHSMHKVVPFVGDLVPEPLVEDPHDVILFGAYSLWRFAERKDYRPGVLTLRPFVHEAPWQSFMLNGPDARFLSVADIPSQLSGDDQWFVRPVSDSKEQPGKVRSASDIRTIATNVLRLDPRDIPPGSLRHDTMLMLTRPAQIFKEWRVWIVNDQVVTYSLYKEGARVVYRAEIDADARDFVEQLVAANPGFAPAYVIDICRTDAGLKFLETNCINGAGFYAADLMKLVAAIEDMAPV